MPEYLPERYQRPQDEGQQETNEIISEIEDELNREYGIAANDMKKKALEYLLFFLEADKKKRKELEIGTIDKKEYRDWRFSKMMTGKRWFEFLDVLSTDLSNTNIIADSIIYGYMPEAYAVGINFSTYNIETSGLIDTSFTLYSKQTVERIIRDKPDMIPKPTVDIPKDKRWNKEKLNSAVTQGILQGESIPEIAERVSEVATMTENQAVRTARTMITNAENGGRNDGFKRAESMGVDLTIEWSATLDHRTRMSHRQLDGQRKKVDEYFEIDGIKLKYPADLGGKDYKVPASEIWNCRCTMLAWVKDFESDKVTYSPKLKGVSYEDWKKAKTTDPNYKAEMRIKPDRRQFDEYTSLNIKGMPKTFKGFQNMKYNQPDKWAAMKKAARKARRERRNGV